MILVVIILFYLMLGFRKPLLYYGYLRVTCEHGCTGGSWDLWSEVVILELQQIKVFQLSTTTLRNQNIKSLLMLQDAALKIGGKISCDFSFKVIFDHIWFKCFQIAKFKSRVDILTKRHLQGPCVGCGASAPLRGHGLTRLRRQVAQRRGPGFMGPYAEENLAPACSMCNMMKGGEKKIGKDFLQRNADNRYF